MSQFTARPDLVLEALAKLVHMKGGYVKLTRSDPPIGPFNLASCIDWKNGTVELRLLPAGVDVNSEKAGTA
jgi:hypothetical protein|tara:strand:+ start:2423 stop:2635 length:213 start_codon:yes stop_codon:yes gene_type:complete